MSPLSQLQYPETATDIHRDFLPRSLVSVCLCSPEAGALPIWAVTLFSGRELASGQPSGVPLVLFSISCRAPRESLAPQDSRVTLVLR